MGSGRTLKFAVCEVLQFAGLCVPLFIVMQRFAIIVAKVKTLAQPPGDGSTAYWLIVASSIAYVTSAALLVWVPMKYMIRCVFQIFPLQLMTLWFLSKVQINNNIKHDTFMELPVSLVLFSLICIDVVERIRHCRLTGQGEHAVPATLPTAAGQINDRNQNGAGARPETNGTVPGIPGNPGRPFSISGLSSRSASTTAYHIPPYAYTGPLRFLCASDARADVFVDSFMFWMDTVEMVRVAGHPLVYYSGWVFPIYIFSYLSCLRVVVMPHSPLLSSLGVALQDLPFFFVRVGLIAFFGFVTPLLYLMKNLLICLAFIYFNFMTKLRIFNTERMCF
uniref:Transmembrane protein 236 n=1 Tax=Sphaeramia orbicularis TaxID=375764 RepID=A0A673BKC9_9TELE